MDKRKIAEFFDHMQSGGGIVDTCVMYDALHGWRVGFGMDGKMMLMSHSQSKKIGEHLKTKPGAPNEAAGLADQLIELADECRMKNRDKVVPDGYAEMLPVMGSS